MVKTANFRGAVAVAMLAPLAACGSAQDAAPKIDTAAVASEVKSDMQTMVAAFNAHDAEGAVALDGPDFVGMFHGMANVVGADQDLAVTKEQTADPAAKVTVSAEQVDVADAGDMALYTASYVFDFTNPATKKPATEYGNWVLVFKRQPDGSMKLYRSVVSDTPAPAAAEG